MSATNRNRTAGEVFEELEAAAVSSNGQRPTIPTLPADFWGDSESNLARLERHAHHHGVGRGALALAALVRVNAYISPAHRLPAIVGTPASLNLYGAPIGLSGVGKSAAHDVAADSFKIDVADGCEPNELPPGSGEGLTELYFDYVEEEGDDGKTRKVRRQTRNRALLYVDEGEALTLLGGRQGATLLPELRKAWNAAMLGQQNAAVDRRRRLPRHGYRLSLLVAFQPQLLDEVLVGRPVTAGTPQRFVWASALDPDAAVPEGNIAALPPIVWTPPPEPRHAGEVFEVDVPLDVVAEIRARHAQVRSGALDVAPVDAHRDLNTLKVAGSIAALEGHRYRNTPRLRITDDDWHRARCFVEYSDQVRAQALDLIAADARRRAVAARERHVGDTVAATRGVELDALERCARKVAAIVWTEGEATRKQLQRRLSKTLRDVLDDGIVVAIGEGWIVEHREAGQGEPRRVLRPGDVKP